MLERVNSSCVRIRMKEKIKNLTPSQSNTKPSMFFNHSLTRSDVQRSTNLTPRSRSEEEEEDMLKVVSKSFLKILVSFIDTAFTDIKKRKKPRSRKSKETTISQSTYYNTMHL